MRGGPLALFMRRSLAAAIEGLVHAQNASQTPPTTTSPSSGGLQRKGLRGAPWVTAVSTRFANVSLASHETLMIHPMLNRKSAKRKKDFASEIEAPCLLNPQACADWLETLKL